MIMQEFEIKRNQTNLNKNVSKFDDVPVLVTVRSTPIQSLNQSINVNSTSTTPQFEVPIQINKQRGPFPYLKRKSIRVDLVLKKQKQQAKKKQSVNVFERLRKEKKALQEENAILKGRLLQMEKLFREMTNFIPKTSTKTQECQTKVSNTKVSNKNSLVECQNCHKCHKAKYMKYHQRICGNTQLKRLLNAKDLQRLEIIRKNQKFTQPSPVNNWRLTRQQFLNQLKKDKSRTSTISCLAAYKRNFRK